MIVKIENTNSKVLKSQKKLNKDLANENKKGNKDQGVSLDKLLGLNVDYTKNKEENLKGSITAIAGLASSENKTLGAIGKAAAIANITMDTIQGVMKAWALGPILGPILAPLVGAAGAASAAKIAGVKFEQGGIVGGSSFTGDNIQARLNSGEMVLNKGQQSQLFNLSNGGGSSSGMIEAIHSLGDRISNMEIVLIADDNEIAKSTSRGVEAGIVIGRS